MVLILLRALTVCASVSFVAALAGCGCSCQPDPPPLDKHLVHFPMTVYRFTESEGNSGAGSVSFTQGEAKRALHDASLVLQIDDDGAGDEDVECMVEFQLQPPPEESGIDPANADAEVETFTDDEGAGYIYTVADWRRIVAKKGCVKVVYGIFACGDDDGGSSGTILGCGQTGGSSSTEGQKFVVTREFQEQWWGKLWAHEFGHTQGIDYHTDSMDDLMYPSIGDESRYVSAEIAVIFRKPRAENACDTTTISGQGHAGHSHQASEDQK